MRSKIICASDFAVLDSNVYTGGGTDDTAALQAVLDKAPEWGGVKLIMDGAALVTGLRLHSNTTIECLNKDCGFFLKAQSNRSIVTNADRDFYTIRNKNITLTGGTYNHNCREQKHHVPADNPQERFGGECANKAKGTFLSLEADGGDYRLSIALEFYGVEHFLARDLTIRNQRTFTLLMANFKNVLMENIHIDLPDNMPHENQDGLHFWGPGQFLTLRNISGCAGDDFISITPDEHDLVSGITDVLVDGVFLDGADQCIRFMSHGTGRLDRVTVRNVTGVYKDFGFFINPWYGHDRVKGNIGSLTFENIDLVQEDHKYDYSVPLLFRLGGEIEKITLRNIRHRSRTDVHTLLQLGGPYDDESTNNPNQKSRIGTLIIDGLDFAENPDNMPAKGIEVKCPVENIMVSRAILRNIDQPLVKVFAGGSVENLLINQVISGGGELTGGDGTIKNLSQTDIF